MLDVIHFIRLIKGSIGFAGLQGATCSRAHGGSVMSFICLSRLGGGLLFGLLFLGLIAAPVLPAHAQALAFSATDPAAPVYPYRSDTDELAAAPHRQVVAYATNEPAGTVIIDPAHTFLYLTLGDGMALRYGIGVGRKGFEWSGAERISRKAEWPDWTPPAAMVARQPYLPRWIGGGPGNPLGARALYLGHTDYRIHGTNDPTSIGKHMSSGCIRLLNADVIDLYNRVNIGTKVIVLPNRRAPLITEAAPGTTRPLQQARPARAARAAMLTDEPSGIY
jgi:lipoprotein-anchoring transpeptidase ErfK/SrfK